MRRLILFGFATIALAAFSHSASADLVSFKVDPTTINDSNMDGFVNGNDFQPVGSDGTVFIFEPTNNLVGSARLLLSQTDGLRYGGGGGSSLSIDFSVSSDIVLESYTLSDSGFFLSNPSFNIMEGTTVLSSTNTSNNSGDVHGFNGGPIDLTAGTIYSFDVQVSGAAVQAFMDSWTYSRSSVPEPSSAGMLVLSGLAYFCRRRRG